MSSRKQIVDDALKKMKKIEEKYLQKISAIKAERIKLAKIKDDEMSQQKTQQILDKINKL